MEILGYRILREIGRGGMATVYLAVQESLDRKVALKVMSVGLAKNETFKKRFVKEGRTVACLNHRHIVTIFDIGFADDICFIAMEYVVGRNLAERIRDGLTTNQSVDIVKRVASALSHAHDRGFIHRDIKASNILFRDDKDAVLADFGIAKSLQEDEGLTVAGLTPGTPSYMSPEQFRGRPLDGRSDLYSLGVLFYEMLTRQRPFDAGTGIATAMRHINDPPPELPDEFSFLRPVMSRLLAKEPNDRFSDAAELIKALDQSMPHAASAWEPDETIFEPETSALETEARAFELEAATAVAATRESGVATFEPAAANSDLPATTLASAVTSPGETTSPTVERVQQGTPGASVSRIARKSPLLWSVAGVIVAGVLAVLLTFNVLQEEDVTPPNQQPSEEDVTPREQQPSSELSADTRLKVERLLEVADIHFLVGRIMEPPGSNAFDAYRQVLHLHPADARAAAGLERIADYYYDQARAHIEDGSIDQARASVVNGLRAWPEHQGLLALRQKYDAGESPANS